MSVKSEQGGGECSTPLTLKGGGGALRRAAVASVPVPLQAWIRGGQETMLAHRSLQRWRSGGAGRAAHLAARAQARAKVGVSDRTRIRIEVAVMIEVAVAVMVTVMVRFRGSN